MNKKYEHLLHLPHPVSETHPRMSASQRAAQFAPFAALTGYEDVIRETARQTQGEIYLDEGEVEAISRRLLALKQRIAQKPEVCLRIFVPDGKKPGGRYCDIRGRVIKIDKNSQIIGMETGEVVAFSNIIQFIDGESEG